LVRRYFITRGPATVQDFAWWSGLTVKDGKDGLAMSKSVFESEKVNGKEYFFKPGSFDYKKKIHSTFLLPDYDEYGISYKDRSLFMDELTKIKSKKKYPHTVIINGVAGGTWRWKRTNKRVQIETLLFTSINKTKQQALARAEKMYTSFFT